ncbi:MAG: winged helix-turn-helix domain-containing protein [Thermoproteota archaeon]
MKPDLYVIARIIKILRENSRMKKINLATASGLAYDKLTKYLEWMMEKDFVEIDSEGFVYLTSKGNKAYEELVKWILEHIGRLEFPRF